MNIDEIEYNLYVATNTRLRVELLHKMRKVSEHLEHGLIDEGDAYYFLKEAVVDLCEKQSALEDLTFPIIAADEEG